MTWGATVTKIETPDRKGNKRNIVLGYRSFEEYLRDERYYLGATIGRYANRIACGRFELDGKTHQLSVNAPNAHLHGGFRGFHRRIWDAEQVEAGGIPGVRFTLISPEGEEGYPGEAWVAVTYALTENNELTIDYDAVASRDTPINLTNHSYFNLGDGTHILDHELHIYGDEFTETDQDMIPTGRVISVRGTPLDFTAPRMVGRDIDRMPAGYDHNFVLRRGRWAGECRLAARVQHSISGRALEVCTTEPGLQLYTAHYFDGSQVDSSGRLLTKHAGLTLEAQHFPDSPNQRSFPDTILRPGSRYRQTTTYRFFVLP
jgi:aldose 1-epimerase